MAVAAMQGADQEQFGVQLSIFPKNTLKCKPRELNQWPSSN